ncbi:MAG: hypothetical protein HPY45_05980 [Anaerolineae bacterium]|nr:hypothetical protein [Anaerolineae bacterium]
MSDQPIIPQPFFRRRNVQIFLFVLLLAFIFFLTFRKQIWDTFTLFYVDISLLFGGQTPNIEITEPMLVSRDIILVNLLNFLIIFILTAIIIAPALLPITTFREIYNTLNTGEILRQALSSPHTALHHLLLIAQQIWRTLFHFLLHTFGLLGPAIFVKDGSTAASEAEMRRNGIGVAVVDYNSAIVLEEEVPAFTLRNFFYIILEAVLWGLGLYNRYHSPRIEGAGIVFIRRLERIRSIVDLRRQTRSRLNVRAYTRDGIEVSTIVWVLFTLGQDPDIQQVSYIGEQQPENLRVITLRRMENGNLRVTEIKNCLQREDALEIHTTFQSQSNRTAFLLPYHDLPTPPLEPVFNAGRVFNAAFNQARDRDGNLIPWQALPLNLTIEAFRRILLQYNFDQIFSPDPHTEPDAPITSIRENLNQEMVNSGLLSYRIVSYRHTGGQLSLHHEYPADVLRVSRILPLNRPSPLRQRGIKIIAAGFTDLMVSDLIYEQRLQNWQASLESQKIITQATKDLEAMRLQTKARLERQEAILANLTQIFEINKHSDEALTLSVLQWIETMVAESPYTRKMLPDDILSLLRTTHNLLAIPEHTTSPGSTQGTGTGEPPMRF